MEMTEIKNAVDELQRGWHEFRKENDERLQAIEKRGSADALMGEKLGRINARMDELQEMITRARRLPSSGDSNGAELTAEQQEYKTQLGIYLRKGNEDNLRVLEQKAMNVGSDPDGGYWVLPDTNGRIAQKIFESSPIREIATVQPISTDALEGDNDLDEAGAGWAGETSTRPETTTPDIGRWRITVEEMYAEPRATQKLLDDSTVDPEAWLVGKVSQRFARLEAAAFVNGNGVVKPRGFANYPTAATADGSRPWGTIEHVATGVSGGWPASAPADKLIELCYKLKQAYRTNARWVMPRVLVGEVRAFKDDNKQYIWMPGIAAGQPQTILGHPVTEAEDVPAKAANSLSVWFGDFRVAYQIVDRLGMQVLRDPYTAKPFVKFYCRRRVGGAVINFEAIKALKFA